MKRSRAGNRGTKPTVSSPSSLPLLPLHTPGPWVFNGEFEPATVMEIRAGDINGEVIAEVYPLFREKDEITGERFEYAWTETALANARLILAAGELLAACQLALGLFQKDHALDHFDWGKSALRAEDIRELNELALTLREAITKALRAESPVRHETDKRSAS